MGDPLTRTKREAWREFLKLYVGEMIKCMGVGTWEEIGEWKYYQESIINLSVWIPVIFAAGNTVRSVPNY